MSPFVCGFHIVSWHTALMVAASLPDLDQLDAEALKALLIAGHSQLLEQRATLAALHAELDEHRQTLTAQSEQLRSSSER